MAEWKIVLHQWIIYAYALGENTNTWNLLPGKQSTVVDSNNVQGSFFICDNYSNKFLIGGKICESAMNYDTDKHGLIRLNGNIGN